MKNQFPDFVWVTAYIDRDHLSTVEKDLITFGFSAVRVFIPTVRVLKKRFKNHNVYEYVPLLFNYGFFNIPYSNACDPSFLKRLKNKIPAIYAWVRDPIKTIKTSPNLRVDNTQGVRPLDTSIAIVNEEEIAELIKTSEHLSVFSDDIADKLKEGQFITLKGYPYEGMPAEIQKIDRAKRKIKVKLLLECVIAEATISYENIFYTVYSDYGSNMRESSIEDIEYKNSRVMDKIYANIYYGEED